MNLTDWMQTVVDVRVGLWAANLLIYGYALWLYLQPARDDGAHACPLCGSSDDVFCLGLQPRATADAGRQARAAAAVHTPTAGRCG